MRIGIISDTHGLLRPGVADVFASVDHILHAGDIGGEHVLRALRELAPVTFVGGNNDEGSDGLDIVRVTLGELRVLLTHILPKPEKPRAAVVASMRKSPADLVVFGHSHHPFNDAIGGVRFFNPASAGPKRFRNPVLVGLFEKGVLRHIPL
ncbi:MAG TPA: metallophosphoesterase family protein [Thermoanaerobaculia bacterium]